MVKEGKSPPRDTETGETSYVENVSAPELYADQAAYFTLKNGNISLTLTSYQLAASPDQKPPYTTRRAVIGRLTMPAKGAQALAVGLYNFLDQNGLGPRRVDSEN